MRTAIIGIVIAKLLLSLAKESANLINGGMMMKRFKKLLFVVLALTMMGGAATYVHGQRVTANVRLSPYVYRHFWIPSQTTPNVQSGIEVRPNLNFGIVEIRTRVRASGAGGVINWSNWGTRGGINNTVNIPSGNHVTWSPNHGANCNSSLTGEYQFTRNTGWRARESAPNATAALSRCR